MNRRALLRASAALPMAGIAPIAALAAGSGRAIARVRPGQPGWPSGADWEALRKDVGAALITPTSPYGPCLSADSKAACGAMARQLQNPFWLGDQPGGTQVSGWSGAWTPQVSARAVAARSPTDVAAAVNFARKHRLRLVVKGGGHSYQGTSNAPDSLLVWTRAMNRIELHDRFVPAGCEGVVPPAHAVSIQAGAMWIDAYDAVTTQAGRYVQGGGCTTVGVAGHIQSGGFGSFSKGFGTAAGSLLEAEVVTADGRIRVVNARRDPELYWALKGGGGGSWGVVTRVTVRTHDLPAEFGYAEIDIRAASDAAFRRLTDRFLAFYAADLMNPHWGEQAALKPGNVLKIRMCSQGLSADQVKVAWAPFLDWVRASPADFTVADGPYLGAGPARGWWDVQARRKRGSTSMHYDDRPGASPVHAWWEGDQDQVSAFLHGYDSLWLPASLLAPARRASLVDALFAASRHEEVGLHFNKGLAGAPPEALALAADTATNPAAMSAFALAIVANGGLPPLPGIPLPPEDPGKAQSDARAVDLATAELLRVAPEGGSYVSESNYFNPRWRSAFWGRNADRLQRAKTRYDPEGLFFVHHGIGSEAWSADGFTRAG